MATAATLTDFNVPYTARVFLCRRTSAPERMDLFSYMQEDARRNDPIVSSLRKAFAVHTVPPRAASIEEPAEP